MQVTTGGLADFKTFNGDSNRLCRDCIGHHVQRRTIPLNGNCVLKRVFFGNFVIVTKDLNINDFFANTSIRAVMNPFKELVINQTAFERHIGIRRIAQNFV